MLCDRRFLPHLFVALFAADGRNAAIPSTSSQNQQRLAKLTVPTAVPQQPNRAESDDGPWMDRGVPLVPSEQSPPAPGPGCLLIRPNQVESRYDPEQIARLV